ncbi:hypothetical protein cand_029660 [Cryptosporidium andersoni]|uniref:ribonuclease Z n=1 Tax=Cryptosporidium andersoni TaxID=117008 RepID=A0A1J4MNA6_9CRYT|nr:hypothetical protein cand_029660 [Cryptosporidium andersoni]
MVSEIYFQNTGCNSLVVPPSLLFVYDGYRALINIGENTQRFCNEHRIRLSRISDIFITYVSTETVAGLPGILLTAQGLGNKKIRVIGPPPLLEFITMMGYTIKKRNFGSNTISFTFNYDESSNDFDSSKNMDIEVVELRTESELSFDVPNSVLMVDCGIRVYFVQVSINNSQFTTNYDRKKKKRGKMDNNESVFVAQYIFEYPDIPGKIDSQKAKLLGIEPGPLYAILRRGESVVLSSSNIVTHDQVCEPPTKIPCSIIIHPLNELHYTEVIYTLFNFLIKMLRIKEKEFTSEYSMEGYISYIFNFSKPALQLVLNELDKIGQLDKLSTLLFSQSRHIYIDQTDKPILYSPFVTASVQQNILHCISASIFPIPKTERRGVSEVSKNILLNRYDIFPLKRLNGSFYNDKCIYELYSTAKDVIFSKLNNLSSDIEHCRQILRECNEALQNSDLNVDTDSLINQRICYPYLYILGTGSAIPSRYRNVSGNIILVNKYTSILLDCGEGSVSQIFYLHGYRLEELLKFITTLKVCFISHAHADHYIGLLQLIQIRLNLLTQHWKQTRFTENFIINNNRGLTLEFENKDTYTEYKLAPLIIIGPRKIEEILNFHAKNICNNEKVCSGNVVKKDELFIFISTQEIIYKSLKVSQYTGIIYKPDGEVNNNGLTKINGLYSKISLEPFVVEHINDSYGACVKFMNCSTSAIYSLVFSGDTKPCENVVNAARNCDILIHEATFGNEFAEEATRKLHSTFCGAVSSGYNSCSQITLLTHFSQRYPVTPFIEFNESILFRYFQEKTLFAIDLAIIPLNFVKDLPSFFHSIGSLLRRIHSSRDNDR